MTPDPAIGTVVAGYRIVAPVSRGGMGVVYRAEEVGLGDRPVALKLLSPALAGDPAFRERFLREMRVAAAIDHPNIVPVYRAGEEQGRLYIAMRYVDALDLRRVLQNEGRLAAGRTVAILEQVARALDAAHARGLVHRDVKPGNILLMPPATDEEAEHVYLVDFGLARAASDDLSISGAGLFIGTPRYAAPHIGLATRHVVHVRRVQQPTLDLVLQQLPDRLPVAPGRLHPHPGHPEAAQPLGQQHQPGGRRGEPAGLGVAPAVVVRHPHAGGHRVLVHVQASATRNQRLHLLALLHLGNGRHPEEPLPEESESRARGNSSECPRLPRQTYQRARGTKERRRWPDDRHIFIRRGWPATATGGLSAK
jgi:hypothetical protein